MGRCSPVGRLMGFGDGGPWQVLPGGVALAASTPFVPGSSRRECFRGSVSGSPESHWARQAPRAQDTGRCIEEGPAQDLPHQLSCCAAPASRSCSVNAEKCGPESECLQ